MENFSENTDVQEYSYTDTKSSLRNFCTYCATHDVSSYDKALAGAFEELVDREDRCYEVLDKFDNGTNSFIEISKNRLNSVLDNCTESLNTNKEQTVKIIKYMKIFMCCVCGISTLFMILMLFSYIYLLPSLSELSKQTNGSPIISVLFFCFLALIAGIIIHKVWVWLKER